MDISVSQLNNRLSLQLPAELPLGLVFVAGRVCDLVYESEDGDNGRQPQAHFILEQDRHSLRCDLKLRPGDSVTFEEGAQIRVGGHLAFDTQQLQYYLQARDVEVIGVDDQVLEANGNARDLAQGDEALLSALAGIKRRSELAQQTQSDLPIWVKKLAPEAVKESELLESGPLEDVPLEEEEEDYAGQTDLPQLNEEMVHYLSTLMDSEDEVELTPGMLAQWRPATDMPAQDDTAVADVEAQTQELKEWANDLADVADEAATAVRPYDPVADSPPKAAPKPAAKTGTRQTDWLVIIAIVALVVFALALVLAIFAQFLQ